MVEKEITGKNQDPRSGPMKTKSTKEVEEVTHDQRVKKEQEVLELLKIYMNRSIKHLEGN